MFHSLRLSLVRPTSLLFNSTASSLSNCLSIPLPARLQFSLLGRNMSSPVSRLVPLLQKHGLSAYVILSDDAHASEYVAACDKRREFISGFTGSAGTALVLNPSLIGGTTTQSQKHRLWTDGRYWTQAEHELEDVGPNSTENRHALQEFDPRFLHGDTPELASL